MKTTDKPITSLLADLTRETSTLVQQEVQLAKLEINEKISQMETGLSSLISGGIVAFAGVLILLQALVLGVAELISPWTIQPWVAPLIVGLVVALIGLFLLQKGRHNLEAEHLVPRRTGHQLGRDRTVLKEQLK